MARDKCVQLVSSNVAAGGPAHPRVLSRGRVESIEPAFLPHEAHRLSRGRVDRHDLGHALTQRILQSSEGEALEADRVRLNGDHGEPDGSEEERHRADVRADVDRSAPPASEAPEDTGHYVCVLPKADDLDPNRDSLAVVVRPNHQHIQRFKGYANVVRVRVGMPGLHRHVALTAEAATQLPMQVMQAAPEVHCVRQMPIRTHSPPILAHLHQAVRLGVEVFG
mmetsp:Transcript_112576/g.317984  ORF Transcript_112576/g.317984 Transcript_112576/m.317984 type:complete len:223 (-) Transcript_112576:474-1142(-)